MKDTQPQIDLVKSSESFAKRRRSRWDHVSDKFDGNSESNVECKSKRSRWDMVEPQKTGLVTFKLPDFKKILNLNSEEVSLSLKLHEIDKRLQTGNLIIHSEDGQRSLSPKTADVKEEASINQRKATALKNLIRERETIVEDLTKKYPSFKPPSLKQYRKIIYIPVKEYPEYNFLGRILGPRGNTLKHMESESGAILHIRGKGSKAKKPKKSHSLSENEDLHVIVEAYTKESMEIATIMIEKLLVPVKDQENTHKKEQLKELAMLDAKFKNCSFCGGKGHTISYCPTGKSEKKRARILVDKDSQKSDDNVVTSAGYVIRNSVSLVETNATSLSEQSTNVPSSSVDYMSWLAEGIDDSRNQSRCKSSDRSQIDVVQTSDILYKDSSLQTEILPNKFSEKSIHGPASSTGYKSWLAESVRKSETERFSKSFHRLQPEAFSAANLSYPLCATSFPSVEVEARTYTSDIYGMSQGVYKDHALGEESKSQTIYVGCLPIDVDKEQLIALFSMYGSILEVKIFSDGIVNGTIRTFAFIRFAEERSADRAATIMNGCMLKNSVLVVRVSSGYTSSFDPQIGGGYFSMQQQHKDFGCHSDVSESDRASRSVPISRLTVSQGDSYIKNIYSKSHTQSANFAGVKIPTSQLDTSFCSPYVGMSQANLERELRTYRSEYPLALTTSKCDVQAQCIGPLNGIMQYNRTTGLNSLPSVYHTAQLYEGTQGDNNSKKSAESLEHPNSKELIFSHHRP